MSQAVIPIERIASAILMLRDRRVMLDYNLAVLYAVETRALKQAVRRNPDRFPNDFMFELSEQEIDTVVSQFVIPDRRRFGGAKPMAFTEQGIAMLSSVLNNERAIKVNIAIMRAFVKLRQVLDTNRELAQKFLELEQRVGKHDEEIAAILEAIRQLIAPPEKARREIGFHVREKAPRYRVRKRA
jgi:ORF6N domain